MRIVLTGLRAKGFHGVLPAEREVGQTFVVDAVLTVDPPVSDELAATVDYAALAASLVAMVEGEPVALIETLASRLLDACCADPRVRSAEVTVHKPEAPVGVPFSDVSVTVAR